MLRIISTKFLDWPQHGGFAIHEGVNDFKGVEDIPEGVRPKLRNFAASEVLTFEDVEGPPVLPGQPNPLAFAAPPPERKFRSFEDVFGGSPNDTHPSSPPGDRPY